MEQPMFAPRVTRRKARRNHTPRLLGLLVRCGCCNERVEIYYDGTEDQATFFPDDETLEINGVIASVAEWRKILLPLLGVVRHNDHSLVLRELVGK